MTEKIDSIKVEEPIPIEDIEIRELAKRAFAKYPAVFKSLAESDIERKELLEKIIEEDFE